jgi:hypothetical protein
VKSSFFLKRLRGHVEHEGTQNIFV